MFEAKFDREEKTEQGTRLYVNFIDNEDNEIITDWIIPASEEDFNAWIEGRKKAYTTGKILKSKLTIGEAITKEEVAVSEISKDDSDRIEWFSKVNRLYRIKVNLIDTTVITFDHPEVVALIKDIQLTEKPGYLNLV